MKMLRRLVAVALQPVRRPFSQLRALPTSLGIGSHGILRVIQNNRANPIKIEIVTGWEDDTTLVGLDEKLGMILKVDKEQKEVELRLSDSSNSTNTNNNTLEPRVVTFSIPENFSVDISLHNGDVKVSGTKLNAEHCNIVTQNGSIIANKIRSHDVILDARQGSVNVTSVVEATTMRLNGRAIHIKRIGAGSEVSILADCSAKLKYENMSEMTKELYSSQRSVIVVNSLYAPSAFVQCIGGGSGSHIVPTSRSSPTIPDTTMTSSSSSHPSKLPPMVLIDSMHGSIDIHVDGYSSTSSSSSSASSPLGEPTLEIAPYGCALAVERITGNVQATVENRGDIEAHFDVVEGDSLFSTSNGRISLMVNQEALARINMKVEKEEILEDCYSNTDNWIEIVEQESRFVEVVNQLDDEEKKRDYKEEDNGRFQTRISGRGENGRYAEQVMNGYVRPHAKREDMVGGVGKGKIDLEAAMRFNSSTSFFGGTNRNLDNDQRANEEEQSQQQMDMQLGITTPLPTISLCASGRSGKVKFESLSWKNSIKRKFGLY